MTIIFHVPRKLQKQLQKWSVFANKENGLKSPASKTLLLLRNSINSLLFWAWAAPLRDLRRNQRKHRTQTLICYTFLLHLFSYSLCDYPFKDFEPLLTWAGPWFEHQIWTLWNKGVCFTACVLPEIRKINMFWILRIPHGQKQLDK